jgi:hypothetical protein
MVRTMWKWGYSFAVCSMLGLTACAQRPDALMPLSQQLASAPHVEKSYQLGEPQITYTGAHMVRVKQYVVRTSDVAVPNTSFSMSPPIPLGSFTGVGGQRYQIAGTALVKGETFYVIPIQKTGMIAGEGAALVRRDGSIFDHPLVTGGLMAPDRFTIDPPSVRFDIDEVKDYSGRGGDNNFELVYSGIIGDNLSILYREYTDNDMARPAFSQELTYDKKASQIRFRNMLIKVSSATSEEIRFTVLSE